MNKLYRSVVKYNPLGVYKRFLRVMQRNMRWFPPAERLFRSLQERLVRYQQRLDFEEFDSRYGTDTIGVIPLKEMTISASGSIAEGLHYEASSIRIFRQFMAALDIPFRDFDFIDFGSGKGRVLFAASEYGFRKLIGIEFAREIAEIAEKNVSLFNRNSDSPACFELHHMDASGYEIPDTPLVIFFYCPFQGKVLDRVLANINESLARHRRPVYLLFNGQNPKVIGQ
ncbi:MAG: hypothetical protein ABL994_24865, partial [Verrucomicrobiales bacterium]